jgi:hypothetical protein
MPKPADTEPCLLVAIALFCVIGLLLSLSGVVLDQHLPDEWF